MQRSWPAFLLTLAPAAAIAQVGRQAGSPRSPADIAITALVPVSAAGSARLCPGAGNSLRVVLSAHGVAVHAVPLRLSLLLPDGPPAGVLIAEGSASVRPDQPTTFTFLHVEVPERIRGRGATLVVRANADQGIGEQDLANDVRQLDIDRSTDWSCR